MLIVSNYNCDIDPRLIQACKENYIIFDQSQSISSANSHQFNTILKAKHTGHNLTDYFQFIISNWDYLPQILRLSKGNIVPRHISLECYLNRINNQYYTSLYSPSCTTSSRSFKSLILNQALYPSFPVGTGLHCEINNNWYKRPSPPSYFKTYDALAGHIFQRYEHAPYLLFIPSACSIVEAERVLFYPKKLYEFLYEITSYTYFPIEAYHVERLLHTLWQCTETLKSSF